ncbi:NUDIX domain-containing protein [Fulvimarina sp. MAC8]|uniref:NUDIX domain-containing protein n=1 Tax=Fulvimarina sp. MAC8 TaxID=3162874 RepID=UPI0032EE44C7
MKHEGQSVRTFHEGTAAAGCRQADYPRTQLAHAGVRILNQHPQIAVSAALFRGDDLLLIERQKGQTLEGLLSFPGGRVGFGETLKQAVAREVLEEVGLDLDESGLVFVTNHEAIYDDFHFVIVVFAAEIGVDSEPVAGSDAAAVTFIHRNLVEGLEENGRTTPKLAPISQQASNLLRQKHSSVENAS